MPLRRACGASAMPPAACSPATPPKTSRRCETRSSTPSPTTSTPRRRSPGVFDWIREANRREGPVGDAQLREMLEIFALDNLLEADEGPPEELVALARRARRRLARGKDFAEADRLRDEVRAAGWEIRDGPAGPELVPVA